LLASLPQSLRRHSHCYQSWCLKIAAWGGWGGPGVSNRGEEEEEEEEEGEQEQEQEEVVVLFARYAASRDAMSLLV
jgi:hypothetical protein